jgi:ubiquinone/menaquinone biosynthesis C-methylase UbiE
MKILDDSQLISFDIEDIIDKRWEIVKEMIYKDFPSGEFSFLDVGGGNGKFADRLLNQYPKCTVTILDNSQMLLNANLENPRKILICDSVENLDKLNITYDLISLNWLLHHLVGNSYSESRLNISSTLSQVLKLLNDGGRISIFENMYDGIYFQNLPGFLIYELTSSKLIAKITKKMGANTAGVGVCFLSKNQWLSTFSKTDLTVLKYSDTEEPWPLPWIWKVFLHMGNTRKGHFWLTPSHKEK